MDMILGHDDLALIFGHLPLRDRYAAAAVCRTLRSVATTQQTTWSICEFGPLPRKKLRIADVQRVLTRAHTGLMVLQLNAPSINDISIAPLTNCTQLRRLDLAGCFGITAVGVVDSMPLSWLEPTAPASATSVRYFTPVLDRLAIAGCRFDYLRASKTRMLVRDQHRVFDQLASLVIGGRLDVDKCEGCASVGKCFTCKGRGCSAIRCSDCATNNPFSCALCSEFVCDYCAADDDNIDGFVHCDDCGQSVCFGCVSMCSDCYERKCLECAKQDFWHVDHCDSCYESKCPACAENYGWHVNVCYTCYDSKCDKCAVKEGTHFDFCFTCCDSKCDKCVMKDDSHFGFCSSCCESKCGDCTEKEGSYHEYCSSCYDSFCEKCADKGKVIYCDGCDEGRCETCHEKNGRTCCADYSDSD